MHEHSLAWHPHNFTGREMFRAALQLGAARPPLQFNIQWCTSCRAVGTSAAGLQFRQHNSNNLQVRRQPVHELPLPGDGTALVLDEAALGKTAGVSAEHQMRPCSHSLRVTMMATAEASNPNDARSVLCQQEEQPSSWQERMQWLLTPAASNIL